MVFPHLLHASRNTKPDQYMTVHQKFN